VVSAGWDGAYGLVVRVAHADGTQTWYAHLSEIVRSEGAVHVGEVIGRVGQSGNATGPHLHFEVHPGGGDPVDPLAWLADVGVTL
jgi:murein DD-endopeptidase MepM/ murein hydrolase activator NlpD